MFGKTLIGRLLSEGAQILVPTNQKQVALLQAYEYLAKGETVVIYPEVQINPENKRLKGKST